MKERVCHENGMGVSSRTDKNKMMNHKSLHLQNHRVGCCRGSGQGQPTSALRLQHTMSGNITSVYQCGDILSYYLTILSNSAQVAVTI